MTALTVASCAMATGCSPQVEVGSMNFCEDQSLLCDSDGGQPDAALPIGAPQYANFNRDAFQHISASLEGDWHGVVAGVESIWSPFVMRFTPGTEEGAGDYEIRCVESRFCVPVGKFEDGRASGQYRVVYVDGDRAGQGEFAWTNGVRQSVKFRNLLLQQSDQVLFFVVDFILVGSFQFVMQRGPWPDAGTASDPAIEPDAGVVEPVPSTDAGAL